MKVSFVDRSSATILLRGSCFFFVVILTDISNIFLYSNYLQVALYFLVVSKLVGI